VTVTGFRIATTGGRITPIGNKTGSAGEGNKRILPTPGAAKPGWWGAVVRQQMAVVTKLSKAAGIEPE